MSANQSTSSLDERFFSTLLKNLPGMAYRFNNDGRWSIEYVSEGAYQLTGWRPEELVGSQGRTIFNLAHPDDVMAGYEKVKAAIAERRPYLLTYRMVSRDGRIKWVYEQGQGVFGSKDEVEAVEGFISDITLQKEAQLALVKSEHNYRSIFENAVFGIFQSLPDGRFLTMNATAARIIGYDDPDEAIYLVNNIATDIYVDPRERSRYLDAIHREGYVSEWMTNVRHRDGRIVSIVENSRGVFDSSGNLMYVEGTVKDITEELAARDALLASERRTSELRAQLADAQLRTLRLQLKPHFLFNVLNTVAMMIRVGETDNAQQMVNLLGNMFRHVLEFEGEETVTLAQELRFCELYLVIQQFRFEDRLVVDRRVDDDTLAIRVPTLILQPLAENSITHGVANLAGRCRVEVVANREGNELVVEISNDTVSPAPATADGHGIGVTNTRARLYEMYGSRATFDLLEEQGRMRAIVRLPVEDSR